MNYIILKINYLLDTLLKEKYILIEELLKGLGFFYNYDIKNIQSKSAEVQFFFNYVLLMLIKER